MRIIVRTLFLSVAFTLVTTTVAAPAASAQVDRSYKVDVAGNYAPARSWGVIFTYVTFYPDGKIMTNNHQIGRWQQVPGTYVFTVSLGGQTHNLNFDFQTDHGFSDPSSRAVLLAPWHGTGVIAGSIAGHRDR